MSDRFLIRGEVEVFPGKGGWYFVRSPKKYTRLFKTLEDRGLVAIIATLRDTRWSTSLLPMGDGTHFIALPAKVRKVQGVELGDKIEVEFELRER